MTSAPSRAVFHLLVKRGELFIRRLGRLAAAFLHMLFAAVLRAIVSSIVFATCAMVMMHYLGVPIPWPSELLDKFENVGRLVSILS